MLDQSQVQCVLSQRNNVSIDVVRREYNKKKEYLGIINFRVYYRVVHLNELNYSSLLGEFRVFIDVILSIYVTLVDISCINT